MNNINSIMRQNIHIVTVLVVLAMTSFSQTISPQGDLEMEEARLRTWEGRVKDLIQISEESAQKLPDPQQAFYYSLLAKITWKHDEQAARVSLRRASNLVFTELAQPRPDGRQHYNYAPKTLDIMFALDQAYTADLIKRINSTLDEDATRQASMDPELANLFGSIGRRIAKLNPELAYAYGVRSLKYGISDHLPGLAVELSSRNRTLAERLVQRAADSTRGRFSDDSYLFAFNLNRYFADLDQGEGSAAAMRRFAAVLFVDLLAGAAQIESERPKRCGIAYYAPTVAPSIAQLLPDRVPIFDHNLRLCLPHLRGLDGRTTETRSNGIPENIDDILKAARDASDTELKIWLYREALYRLMNQKEFERMLSILDGFDGDEYEKFAPVAWGNWRVRGAYGAAITAFESGDLGAASRHVDQTPAALRPFVREKLARSKSISEDPTFFLDLLNGMLQDLNSLAVPAHDAARLLLSLSDLYFPILPNESERAFSKAVSRINKWDSEQREKPTADDWAPMSDYVEVNAGLLTVDEYNVVLSLRSVTSPHSRIRLTLGLLESSLKELGDAQTQVDLRKKKPAGRSNRRSSRSDLTSFNHKMIEEIAEGKHRGQQAKFTSA